MKPEIPAGAYRCRLCWSRCRCHNLLHAECPTAEVRDCEGGCGRKTTLAESCHAGFMCRACAHAPSRLGAWRVAALIRGTDGGWHELLTQPSSYSDALELGSKLDAIGARDVHLVESSGPRPRNRPHRRAPAAPGQLDMFKRRRS